MAIVTRRYVYDGPSLQAVKSKTDPGLTLAVPALKLSFDVTFDDAIASVAAVDEAMSDSGGLVPDPTADTSVPPSFPGGGSSQGLIYRPGSGLPGPVVFDSWTDLMSALDDLRESANGSGCYSIVFDDSIVSPAPIPVGTYDMEHVTWSGCEDALTAVTIPDGVSLPGLRHITDSLQVAFTGTTPPIDDFTAAPFDVFTVERGSSISCTGAGPFLQNSAALLILVLMNGSKINFGGAQAVHVDTAVPGQGVMIVGFEGAEVASNTLSGVAGSAAQLLWQASSAKLSEDQPAFTGAGGILSPMIAALPRKTPTPVITANTLVAANDVARVDTSGGPVVITLPPAFNNRGLSVIVKDVGGTALSSPITILTSGGDTIDSGPSAQITDNHGALTFVSDGVSDWMIV